MTPQARNFVLFKTDLFAFEQPDDCFDRWRVGADCAGWFYARLLCKAGIDCSLEPVMEDWGWTFAVAVEQVRVWTNVWASWIDNCWILGVEAKKRSLWPQNPATMLRAKETVCDGLEESIAKDTRFEKHNWYATNPFDLDIKEF